MAATADRFRVSHLRHGYGRQVRAGIFDENLDHACDGARALSVAARAPGDALGLVTFRRPPPF